MKPSPISVVIRTFNSAKTLDALLDRLDPEEGDEIVIVDSGSADATLVIAQKHGADIIHATGPFNYSRSLNLGFQAAGNDWVLVISSHCIPLHDNLLATLRKEIALFPEDVVVGYGVSTLSGKSDPDLDAQKTTFYDKDGYPAVGRVCGNGNAIYRRTAWEMLPFDEKVRTAEDKIWIKAILDLHYRFAYIPTALGVNRNQQSLKYMFMKGYSDARATRGPDHHPMPLWHLAGALKALAKPFVKGEIDFGNWARYSAHTFGQFFGSRQKEDNTPWN